MLHQFIDVFLHLDTHLAVWAGWLGPWLYAVLFLIIFCETGLVVTPILPGDSLLFSVGALAAVEGSPIHLKPVCALLCLAAVLGDAANYSIGRWVGPHVFTSAESRWLNKEHLRRAHAFYEKYGGKTIILARFMPIIRTFAPFVAGIGTMGYPRFASYNVVGGVAWVLLFTLAGHRFAGLPVVKQHFHYVILVIIFLSVLPGVVEYLRSRRAAYHPS
ncbi:MAG: DedA family protein [Elusimicrobia bacterium]|nr:DedA family protein [Elusimicrobiota bacterium]